MTVDRKEARDAAIALLRHGPKSLRDIRSGANTRLTRLVDAALANGDVQEIGGFLVMRRAEAAPAADTGADAEDARPLPLAQDPVRRAAASAIEHGRNRPDMMPRECALALAAMVEDDQAFGAGGRYALTPFGRVSLLLEERETAILYAIATGERGEKRLARLQETNPAYQETLAELVQQGIVGKNRRYYEIRAEAMRIEAGQHGVPSATRLLSALAA